MGLLYKLGDYRQQRERERERSRLTGAGQSLYRPTSGTRFYKRPVLIASAAATHDDDDDDDDKVCQSPCM